jgi:hypothetical protein
MTVEETEKYHEAGESVQAILALIYFYPLQSPLWIENP